MKRYATHKYCTRCNMWHVRDDTLHCPDCGNALRNTPRKVENDNYKRY